MEEIQIQLRQTIQTFTVQITDLARREALKHLSGAFESDGPSSPLPRRAGKRTPSDLAAIAARLVAFIKTHPGLRIEQVNKHLGTQTRELALPMRKLVTAGAIRTHRHKRSTTYFVKD